MRVLIIGLILLLGSKAASAQVPRQDSVVVPQLVVDSAESLSDAAAMGTALTPDQIPPAFAAMLRGKYLYGQRRYGQALPYLQRSFAGFANEDDARDIYYSLLYTGQSLEAQAFRDAHPAFTYALPLSDNRLESVFGEGGIRMPERTSLTNISYGAAGAGVRFRKPVRLRQHFFYWRLPGESISFHQLESRTSADWYFGKGWLLQPVVHYSYQPYQLQTETQSSVAYFAFYQNGPEMIRYRTVALQTVNSKTSGAVHAGGISLGLQKRVGAFEIVLTPAVQYLPVSYQYQYAYTSSGTTDSVRNGQPLGTAPYYESGAGSGDSAYHSFVYQLGASIGWRPPLQGAPVYLRASGYGLRTGEGFSVGAATGYALVQVKPFIWLHFSALYKAALPLLTGAEGIYLTYPDRINKRIGATVQLFPLRHFSPSLTYQFEELQNSTGAPVYHSVYLTFSYQP